MTSPHLQETGVWFKMIDLKCLWHCCSIKEQSTECLRGGPVWHCQVWWRLRKCLLCLWGTLSWKWQWQAFPAISNPEGGQEWKWREQEGRRPAVSQGREGGKKGASLATHNKHPGWERRGPSWSLKQPSSLRLLSWSPHPVPSSFLGSSLLTVLQPRSAKGAGTLC